MLAEHLHPHIGGVEKHVRRLVDHLSARGHRVTLFTVKHDPSLPFLETGRGCAVHRIRKGKSKKTENLRIWMWWLAHMRLILKSDIIHFHGEYTLLYWFLPFRVFFPWKSMFITFHGSALEYPPRWKGILLKKIAAALTRDHICVGGFLVKWYGIKSTHITYGAVDLPVQRRSAGGRRLAAVFVGRLSEDTGIEIYIRALSVLRERHRIRLKLTICGDGPLREPMEGLARRMKIPAEFKGFVSDPEPYVRSARVVFASGYLAILEAFAGRKPVFAVYANPVKKDYLGMIPGMEDMSFCSSSPEDLAKKLVFYFQKEENFKRRGEKAFVFARSHTWERLTRLYLHLWRIADGGGGDRP